MILRGYHLSRIVPAGCVAFIMFYSRIETISCSSRTESSGYNRAMDVPKLLAHGTAYELVPFSRGRACSRAQDLAAPGSSPQTGMP